MPINVYLNFNGNCRQAVEYYAQIFETEPPQIMTFGDAPPGPDYPLPEEAKNLVMHAKLNISDSTVMFSDTFPGSPFTQGNNVILTLISKNMDEIKAYYEKLKQDGHVEMELQETFWSKCYGSLTDRFGIHWQLSFDNEENS